MRLALENWPRLAVPLFVAASVHLGLTSCGLSGNSSAMLSLFAAVQLQKRGII